MCSLISPRGSRSSVQPPPSAATSHVSSLLSFALALVGDVGDGGDGRIDGRADDEPERPLSPSGKADAVEERPLSPSESGGGVGGAGESSAGGAAAHASGGVGLVGLMTGLVG